ncbi:MAG: FtsQ-type POTRA domain-containing protein [Cyanobacteria bacterium P01_G01_bin.49]
MSAEILKRQRQTLRHQRRLKAWQGVWRFLALCGITGGLIWSFSSPHVMIRGKSQVKITGNRLLTESQIQKMLEIDYPQYIWQLSMNQLREGLITQPPIEEVYLTRQLLPTKITLIVEERQPVAKAVVGNQTGFLDEEGVWIPQTFYSAETKVIPASSLQVLGFDEPYRPYWVKLYPLLTTSAVKITVVDWRDPSNLILKTELGMVHFGSYGDDFLQKLAALAKLRKLPSQVSQERIIYIDLSNPNAPSVHLKDSPSS